MRRIDIYSDSKGHLSLRQYTEGNNNSELSLKDKDVYAYLNKLAKYSIRDVNIKYNSNEIDAMLVKCDKFNIRLLECSKLEQHERDLKPLLDNVEQVLERKKMTEIKKSRASNDHKTPPKVNRQNKYSKHKIIAAALALSAIVGGMSLANSKDEVYQNDISSDISYSDTVIKDNKEEITTSYEISNDIVIEPSNIITNISNVSNPTIENEEVSLPGVSLEYEDRSNTDKAINAKMQYGDIIEKYAGRYGLDPNLVLAIATQERGVHSTVMDSGGATGLMQIQNSVWVNEEISAYNFETDSIDKFVIEEKMLKDVDKNVQIGCMILQNTMKYMDYNIIAAVQCYNMGYGNMKAILDTYASDNGMTRKEVLNNHEDMGWLSYRDMIKEGDNKYVENVFSWLGESNDIKVSDTNNNVVNLKVSNQDSNIKVY